MNILTNYVARVLFILPLLALGSAHFMNAREMADMLIPNIPGNVIVVYITGVAIIAAVVSILIKKKAALATLLLGGLLILTALIVWMPQTGVEDEMVSMAAMGNMARDLGLAGASFFMSGVFKKEEETTS